eukprot:7538871-Pyramimonas_sp.AAC.2
MYAGCMRTSTNSTSSLFSRSRYSAISVSLYTCNTAASGREAVTHLPEGGRLCRGILVLPLGLVGSENVCTGRALAPAPLRGVGASMLLLQSRKGSERVGQIVAEVARRRSQVGPGSVLLHEGLAIVCGAAAPAPSASPHLRGESVHAVADGLLADLAGHFGERLGDFALTIALDILQRVDVRLANHSCSHGPAQWHSESRSPHARTVLGHAQFAKELTFSGVADA